MNNTGLKRGQDCFTRLDLLKKAATFKGLRLEGGMAQSSLRYIDAWSKPIKKYSLDGKILAFLAERGIKLHERPDCNGETITLADENPQPEVPGFAPSNYWNFKLVKGTTRRFDLKMSLVAGLGINMERRGIVLWPHASGTFVSASDPLPNFRMFEALTENDRHAPKVAPEIISQKENGLLISWADLGLGGIRKMSTLFGEFSKGNKAIERLAEKQEVFDPNPYPYHQESGLEMFLAEPAQPYIFQFWQEQLKDYQRSLVI